MIISASYKTDIPAFYGDWFMERLEAGYCGMVNAYNRNQATFISLRPQHVAGIVFWTKHIGPFIQHLNRVKEMGYPFVVQHTINGYAQSHFEAVVNADEAVANLHQIRERFGPRVAVWRYDPIVITTNTPVERHLANFADLAKKLQGATDEVVISFVQPYKKTQANMSDREATYGFDWIDNHDFTIEFEEDPSAKSGKPKRRRIWKETEDSLNRKRALAQLLAGIARDHNMQLTICSPPPKLFVGEMASPETGACPVAAAHCVETKRLQDVIDSAVFQPYLAKDRPQLPSAIKGNRATCECYPSRDIGEYDTCPYGCAYCYAVSDRAVSKRFFVELGSSLLKGDADTTGSPFLDPRHMKRFPDFRDDNAEWLQQRFAEVDKKSLKEKSQQEKPSMEKPQQEPLFPTE